MSAIGRVVHISGVSCEASNKLSDARVYKFDKQLGIHYCVCYTPRGFLSKNNEKRPFACGYSTSVRKSRGIVLQSIIIWLYCATGSYDCATYSEKKGRWGSAYPFRVSVSIYYCFNFNAVTFNDQCSFLGTKRTL